MTNEQLDLLCIGASEKYFYPSPPPGRNPAKLFELFLTLRLGTNDAVLLSPHVRLLKQRLASVEAKEVPSQLWHITLSAIAQFDEAFPQPRLDAIEAACRSISCPAISVVHDRMVRFQPSGAAVLLCTAEAARAIRQLRSALAAALRNVGVTSKASSTPHLTIFYDKLHPIAETALETPLTWQATDFSLVVSHKGLGHHEVVRTWALRK